MKHQEALVLAPNADEFLALLAELPGKAAVTACKTVKSALSSHTGGQVILGQPDLVAELLAIRPEVRWVQSTWAGVEPLLALGRSDYLLTGVKDTFGQQIFEYVLCYLLAYEQRMLERLGRQVNRNWWSEPTGTLAGKTMGVLGTGSIGRHVASMSAPFGIRVLGLNRSGQPAAGFEKVFPTEKLDEFLSGSDYLVCTLPETAETIGLLDARAFDAIKPGSYLVNVGRGSTIDEKALVHALLEGRLGGAALDVFSEEPLPPDSPLWHAPETLVTAHVAAKSRPADIAKIFVENYRRFLAGKTLNYLVDFDLAY